jgi:hypothetical protein
MLRNCTGDPDITASIDCIEDRRLLTRGELVGASDLEVRRGPGLRSLSSAHLLSGLRRPMTYPQFTYPRSTILDQPKPGTAESSL